MEENIALTFSSEPSKRAVNQAGHISMTKASVSFLCFGTSLMCWALFFFTYSDLKASYKDRYIGHYTQLVWAGTSCVQPMLDMPYGQLYIRNYGPVQQYHGSAGLPSRSLILQLSSYVARPAGPQTEMEPVNQSVSASWSIASTSIHRAGPGLVIK